MMATEMLEKTNLTAVKELGQQLRVDSIRMSTKVGSGHPTSSMSAADLIAVLIARHLRYDWNNPKNVANDHLIFSKGHASPLIYAMFRSVGAITEEEMMTYRTFGSRLQGHPTPVLPWVDVATGSLGQGVAIAVGVALAGKYLDKAPYRVFAVCGDSELAEGSVWEAFDKASHYKLDNLIAICDINRLGQRGPTELEWDLNTYKARMEAFGWRVIEIDGHDVGAIDNALSIATEGAGKPTAILAKTIKGKGVPEIENLNGWHGKALPAEMAKSAIAGLGGVRNLRVETTAPPAFTLNKPAATPVVLPKYNLGDAVATRKAYGDALVALSARPDVVVLDGEVGNSTFGELFEAANANRYFEMWIAEQQMVAAAVGMSVRGYIPFAATFAAFLSRAYDFIRMAAVSQANIRLCGSHAGVEIGTDGPSQMALEDLASIRAILGSTIFYPSDAGATAKLTELMADTKGIVYMRTTRGAYPVLYGEDEKFVVGGSKVLRESQNDRATIIGAGVTLHNALAAYDLLQQQGIAVRVIDQYSIKPINTDNLAAAPGPWIVVEDHYPQGGIAAAIMEAFADKPTRPAIVHLYVKGLPTSGTPQELMDAAGIGTNNIVEAVKKVLA